MARKEGMVNVKTVVRCLSTPYETIFLYCLALLSSNVYHELSSHLPAVRDLHGFRVPMRVTGMGTYGYGYIQVRVQVPIK
jgi:hypothetical protein